jgi:hypothetical protein
LGVPGQSLDAEIIALEQERGVYAASSFANPQVNRFVAVRSDPEAA